MATKAGVDPRARAGELVEAGIRSGRPGAQVFGRWLRTERETRGESTAVTAKKLGVAVGVLTSWERGATVPGRASLIKVRRWLGKEGSHRMDARITAIRTGALREMNASGAVAVAKAGPWPVTEPAAEPVKASADPQERLLEAIMAADLPVRAKALLSTAVVTLAAGIDVEIEVRARV